MSLTFFNVENYEIAQMSKELWKQSELLLWNSYVVYLFLRSEELYSRVDKIVGYCNVARRCSHGKFKPYD